MSMMKWSPFDEMEMLKKQIDHVFAPLAPSGSDNGYGFNPAVDVLEAENTYKVRMVLPGLPSENIGEHVNIEATSKTLTVSGELRPRELSGSEKILISQCRYGKFFKQLSFPDGIDHENIQAEYVNGILEISLPKAAAAQKRSIQINVKQ